LLPDRWPAFVRSAAIQNPSQFVGEQFLFNDAPP